MNKPIIDHQYVNVGHLFSFITNVITKYLRTFLYVLLIYLVYVFIIKTPTYFSSASFYTNYKESNSLASFGILSTLTDSKSDTNDLGFSIETYLTSEFFLNEIVQKKYIISGNEELLVDYWGKNYKKILSVNPITIVKKIDRRFSFRNNLSDKEKKLFVAKGILKTAVYHYEDDNSHLHVVGIIADDLELANQITENIVTSIINYSTYITNIKAKEKAEFIQERLSQIKTNVENVENEKLLFIENNKSPLSPSLSLKIDRMNRKILLHSQVYANLSEQLEMAKIDEKNNTSSIYLLDKSNLSPYKPGGSFLVNLLKFCTMFFGVLIVFEAYKKRDSLFLK
jgi:hypothetical protein